MNIDRTDARVSLPGSDGRLVEHRLHEPRSFPTPSAPFTARHCYAAPHVVADVTADYTPGISPPVDWDKTLEFRRYLWKYGIGVAEAMDTSERGPGGLTWPQAQELISRSLEAAREAGGRIVCGAGAEQLDASRPSLDDITRAYVEQLDFIESRGGSAVIRASHALVAVARSADDYLKVYGEILSQAQRPVIIHWLGAVFDPTLTGYWGSKDLNAARRTVVELAHRHESKLAGIKFSLLDAESERQLRERLPPGTLVFTGDDYNYPSLLLGDGRTHSHALLGILDPIAPIASVAFQALEAGDEQAFMAELSSTVPLAIRMFEEPVGSYKTGVVFLAYLRGLQPHFRMVSGHEGMRSLRHLCELFVLADRLGMFPDPDLTAARMRAVLAVSGVTE